VIATTIIAGSSAKPLTKMKPKPSTMFSALGSIGPFAKSLKAGNSTAPTDDRAGDQARGNKAEQNDEQPAN